MSGAPPHPGTDESVTTTPAFIARSGAGRWRLLVLRAAPVVMRPAIVLLEALLVHDNHVLVLLLPVAMMALTISSIPVHLDYFRARPGSSEYRRLGRAYVSGLSWITLASSVVLALVLMAVPLGLSPILVLACVLTFLTEKLSDESCRSLEFRKEFVKWFLVQAARSAWFVLPLAASVAGLPYEASFVVFAAFAAAAMFVIFRRTSGLDMRFGREGFSLIRNNIVFLVGTFLPASYLQLPRIVAATLFPTYAHVFLAVGQLSQAVTLVFNVRYQVPYRKLIARRTYMFQRRMQPMMVHILIASALIAVVYLMVPGLISIERWPALAIGVALVPIAVAHATTFAVLAAHLGYLSWVAGRLNALATYLSCIALAGLCAGLLAWTGLIEHMSLLSLPAVAVLIGLGWFTIIQTRHFPRRPAHV